MEAITEKQKSLIINNIVKACSDIEKLNGTGYKFIHLAYGFIAHYDINGFKDYYTRYDLATDITKYYDPNLWNNFHPEDQNYHYYKSKADIYKRIIDKLSNKTLNLWNS